MPQTLRLLVQIAVLGGIYWSCQLFVTLTGLPVPANVLGILVLFVLLCCGVIKEEQVAMAAGFLLRHLVFFFVPIAVGLMLWGEVFYDYGLILLAAILISSLLPLLTVGWLSALLFKEKKECRK